MRCYKAEKFSKNDVQKSNLTNYIAAKIYGSRVVGDMGNKYTTLNKESKNKENRWSISHRNNNYSYYLFECGFFEEYFGWDYFWYGINNVETIFCNRDCLIVLLYIVAYDIKIEIERYKKIKPTKAGLKPSMEKIDELILAMSSIYNIIVCHDLNGGKLLFKDYHKHNLWVMLFGNDNFGDIFNWKYSADELVLKNDASNTNAPDFDSMYSYLKKELDLILKRSQETQVPIREKLKFKIQIKFPCYMRSFMASLQAGYIWMPQTLERSLYISNNNSDCKYSYLSKKNIDSINKSSDKSSDNSSEYLPYQTLHSIIRYLNYCGDMYNRANNPDIAKNYYIFIYSSLHYISCEENSSYKYNSQYILEQIFADYTISTELDVIYSYLKEINNIDKFLEILFGKIYEIYNIIYIIHNIDNIFVRIYIIKEKLPQFFSDLNNYQECNCEYSMTEFDMLISDFKEKIAEIITTADKTELYIRTNNIDYSSNSNVLKLHENYTEHYKKLEAETETCVREHKGSDDITDVKQNKLFYNTKKIIELGTKRYDTYCNKYGSELVDWVVKANFGLFNEPKLIEISDYFFE